ncbi:S41 family peptidase [Dysgonomonas sp. ZJ709]|uniref:S41 family peptidase n=1 Tax=Dysgonomonas sp. ZJ709 TaxID=2709797 RepID=UPI0013EB8A72|nr:S41 family peptidase [Dysgonomonas sp. ZJ709]
MKAIFQVFFLTLVSMVLFSSCSDDDIENGRTRPSGQQTDNQYVNNWVYEKMDSFYLWRDKLPAKENINFDSSPYDFLDGLIYPFNEQTHEGDRFSWIQESYVDLVNSLNGVSSSDLGFDYNVYLKAEGSTEVIYEVLYIKKNTKAEKSGLKRGDIIEKVDNTTVTLDNWSSLLYQNKNSYTFSLVNQSNPITVEVTSNYIENPIYYSNIYTKGSHKIGYLIYNFFSQDKGDGTKSYDTALADEFSNFYSAGITDLILDLRYNPGGYVESSKYIASAIVPNRDISKLYVYYKYNDLIQQAYQENYGEEVFNNYFADKIAISNRTTYPIPKLGDKLNNTLYVLVTRNTMSASELIINGLRPYMNVVLIGQTTIGKNVGSFSFYEPNDSRNKWGLQPICFQTYNSLGKSEYAAGFIPDDGFEVYENMAPLGDTDEMFLATAIAKITGSPLPSAKKNSPDLKPIGSSLNKKGTKGILINPAQFNKLKTTSLKNN